MARGCEVTSIFSVGLFVVLALCVAATHAYIPVNRTLSPLLSLSSRTARSFFL
jgi:hypothetical protein